MACNFNGNFDNLKYSASCPLGNLQKPFDYAVYTPFVELSFLAADGNRKYFTVGNEGNQNEAVIESFSLNVVSKDGGSSGTITIVTCDYNDVELLIGLVPDTQCFFDEDYLGADKLSGWMNIGWIFNSCENNTISRIDSATTNIGAVSESIDSDIQEQSPYIYCIFNTVSLAFEEGYYKITLNFTFIADSMDLFRNEIIEGQEDQKQELWPSLKNIIGRRCDDTPANLNIQKLRLNADGKGFTTWDFAKSDGGVNGPKGVWSASQLNNVDGAKGIMLSFLTDKDKATFFVFPNQLPKPEFVVLEDVNPNVCLGEKRQCSVDTYIVNGGDCTRVLKFTPEYNSQNLRQTKSVESDFDEKIYAGRGGGGPNALGQTPERINICEVKLDEMTGFMENKLIASSNGKQVNIPANSEDLNHRSPAQVGNKLTATVSTHMAASESSESIIPIKATMEVIGDPYYAGVLNMIQKNLIQVIFLNPFCLKQKGIDGNCEFLAEPPVNQVFSGIYMIQGCSHNITKGSFTTTFELQKMIGDTKFD
jgi:hypothetical protein